MSESRPRADSPRGHACEVASPYAPRRPEDTLLHQTVREHLETFLSRARQLDHPVPRFVEREFRAYLECGVLAHGFLRLHCDACGCDRLLPFSCYLELRTIRSPREEGGVGKGGGAVQAVWGGQGR